jgi:PAS domain S-box-containing protein
MKAKIEHFPAKNPNPMLSVTEDGAVLYSNDAGGSLLREWGVCIGEKLPTCITDIIQKTISRNSLEKMEVKAGKRIFLITFYPSPEEECVNIYGFDITEQKELEEKLSIKEKHNDVLYRIGKIALEYESLQTFMDKSLKLIASILELEYCKIMELLPDGRFLMRAGIGWKPEFVGKQVVGGEKESHAGYTLFSRMPVIVEDFEEENRFKKPEILRIHGVASGASALIGTVENIFGVLIVNSTKKRKFTSDDTYFLTSVAFLIAQVVERKKAEEALKKANDSLEEKVKERTSELEKAYKSLIESEKRLAEAQRMASIGNWDWNIRTNELYWSNEMFRIFGSNPQELIPNYNYFLDCVHPDDRNYVVNSIKASSYEKPFGLDFRIVLANGEERIVHAQKEVIFDEKKTPIRTKGIIQDITERKKAEEKIKILANALESSNDAIVTESLDGIIGSWNKGAEQVYGYSAEEILGKNVLILEPENIKGEVVHLIEKIKHGEKIQHYETLRLKKDGTIINVSITYSPIFDSYGNLMAISAISRDITEHKQIEKALRESEACFRNLFEVISSGVAIYDVIDDGHNFIFKDINPAGEKINRVHREEIIGKSIYEFFPNVGEIGLDKAFRRVWLTGRPEFFPPTFYGDENIALWVTNYIYRLPSGELVAVFDDITERKKAEEEREDLLEAIQQEKERLSALINSITDEVWFADVQKKFTLVNPSALREFCISTKEGIGVEKLASSLDIYRLDGSLRPVDEAPPLRALRGEIVTNDEEIVCTPLHGELRYRQTNASPVRDTGGNIIGSVSVVRDITERKKAEEALANLEAARKKEIHHRIKNNLQVISSLLDMQAEKFKNRESIKHWEVLEAFRESQERVISMALIHEELHKGSGIDTLDFSSYIEQLADNLFQTYRFGNIDINLNMDLEENIFFDMDTAVPLGIIVNELVSNSLKHAFVGRDKGEIQIKICRKASRDCIHSKEESKVKGCETTNFILTVSDNGMGIPENLDIEDLESLGLQLVASLVEQLDGKHELKWKNGTEFNMTFTVTEKINPAQCSLK